MKKCPICAGADYISMKSLCSNMRILGSHFPEGSTDIVYCRKCGLSYLRSDSTESDYLEYYRKISNPVEYYKMFGKENSDHYFNDITQKISSYISKDSRILDFGSGQGELGQYVKSCGYNDVTALDPKDQCIDFCKSQGLKTIKCSSCDILENVKEKYDLIIMNHILEHICDLNQTMSDVKKILNSNGYIYIENPDIKGYVENKDKNTPYSFLTYEHVLHTGIEDIRNLASCTGYEIVECGKYFKEISNYPSVWAVLKPSDNTSDADIQLSENHQFIRSYITQCQQMIYKTLEPLIDNQAKLILWGIGASTAILLNDFAKYNVIGLVDSNPMRQNIRYVINQTEYIIKDPSEITDKDAYIFIMSGPYKDSITRQIRQMGFTNKLLTF